MELQVDYGYYVLYSTAYVQGSLPVWNGGKEDLLSPPNQQYLLCHHPKYTQKNPSEYNV